MSLTSLMNLGARAMFAAQAQIQTTGHNIANASVEGYSRQEVSLTTARGMYSGAGYFGRGVDVQTVERSVNAFLTNQAALAGSASASDEARLDMLKRLEKSFGTGEAGLGYVSNQFLQAFSDVAAKPDDLSARQVVLARGQDLASLYRSTSDQLTALQAATKEDVKNTVTSVNELAQQIAKVNADLAGYTGSSHSPNDLLDERDRLIAQLAEQVQVTRVEQDDGSMNLFVGGNQSLVIGATAYNLVARDDPADTSRIQVAVDVDGSVRALDETALGGGSLQGLLHFQNEDLDLALDQLNSMAASFVDAVNERQTRGIDLDGQAGLALFNVKTGMEAQSITLSNLGARDLAAANPILLSPNAGTTSRIASVVMTGVDTETQGPYSSTMSLSFARDATSGAISYEFRDSSGSLLQSGAWNAGDAIDFNGYQIKMSGVPADGDAFTIGPNTTPGSNNGNALAFVSLATQKLVHDQSSAGRPDQSLTDYYASLLADVGTRVQTTERAADVSATVADQAQQQLSADTGVNLDEEAARLLQYQQSYQAAAKVLQTAQKVFDTVLALGG